MKKIIKSLCALSLAGTMFLSGCSSEKKSIDGNTSDVTINSGDTYAVISVADYGDIKVKLFPDAAPVGVKNFIDLAESGYYEGKSIHRVISNFMLQGGSLNGDGTGGTSAEGGEFECEVNANMRHFYGALCYANAAGSNTCQFYIVNNKTPQADIEGIYSQNSEYYSMMIEAYSPYLEQFDKNSQEYMYFESTIKNAEKVVEGAKIMTESLTDEIIAKYAEVGGTPSLDGGYTVFGQTVEGFDVIDAISSVETELGSDGAESKPVDDIIISSVTIKTAE